jgi:hypothetical protein
MREIEQIRALAKTRHETAKEERGSGYTANPLGLSD